MIPVPSCLLGGIKGRPGTAWPVPISSSCLHLSSCGGSSPADSEGRFPGRQPCPPGCRGRNAPATDSHNRCRHRACASSAARPRCGDRATPATGLRSAPSRGDPACGHRAGREGHPLSRRDWRPMPCATRIKAMRRRASCGRDAGRLRCAGSGSALLLVEAQSAGVDAGVWLSGRWSHLRSDFILDLKFTSTCIILSPRQKESNDNGSSLRSARCQPDFRPQWSRHHQPLSHGAPRPARDGASPRQLQHFFHPLADDPGPGRRDSKPGDEAETRFVDCVDNC